MIPPGPHLLHYNPVSKHNEVSATVSQYIYIKSKQVYSNLFLLQHFSQVQNCSFTCLCLSHYCNANNHTNPLLVWISLGTSVYLCIDEDSFILAIFWRDKILAGHGPEVGSPTWVAHTNWWWRWGKTRTPVWPWEDMSYRLCSSLLHKYLMAKFAAIHIMTEFSSVVLSLATEWLSVVKIPAYANSLQEFTNIM